VIDDNQLAPATRAQCKPNQP